MQPIPNQLQCFIFYKTMLNAAHAEILPSSSTFRHEEGSPPLRVSFDSVLAQILQWGHEIALMSEVSLPSKPVSSKMNRYSLIVKPLIIIDNVLVILLSQLFLVACRACRSVVETIGKDYGCICSIQISLCCENLIRGRVVLLPLPARDEACCLVLLG